LHRTYRRRFDGVEEAGVGRGATLEGLLVSQIMVEEGMRNEKFLPLLPDGERRLHSRLLRSYNEVWLSLGLSGAPGDAHPPAEVVPLL